RARPRESGAARGGGAGNREPPRVAARALVDRAGRGAARRARSLAARARPAAARSPIPPGGAAPRTGRARGAREGDQLAPRAGGPVGRGALGQPAGVVGEVRGGPADRGLARGTDARQRRATDTGALP